MEAFEIIFTERETVTIALVKGYFNAEAGETLNKKVDLLGLKGQVRIIVDFSQCTLLNSPGVTSMVDIVLKVTEDFDGKLVLVGLDNLKFQVLKTVHVIPPGIVATNLEEAFSIASS